ncbi:MAG: hypothetical protein RL531_662 [Actinomycetota bacterium]
MLRRVDLRGEQADATVVLGSAGSGASDDALDTVRAIIADVRDRGDDALRDTTAHFDGVHLDVIRVDPARVAEAWARAPGELRAALEFAAERIRAYHEAQRDAAGEPGWGADGIDVAELVRPVDRAGLYVPGGRAAYPSTVLMTAIPARVAGVPELALCVPPGPDGFPPDSTLAAAHLAGVDEVYRIGGAQAIAALAYGTASIRAVDVIVGPGNRYVSLAKGEVSGDVGIDSLAGPSELVVIADASAPAAHVALDLMAQAEHGPDGTAVVIAWDPAVLDAVDDALGTLVADAPRRREIESNFAGGGVSVLVRDAAQAVEVSNLIAPEHLELAVGEPEPLLDDVRCAGAVFCGPWAPAVVGDYVAGPNHVLPTGRSARFSSALRVDTFRKHIHVVRMDRTALERVAPYVAALTAVEGLASHGEAVARRVRP